VMIRIGRPEHVTGGPLQGTLLMTGSAGLCGGQHMKG
jgi:hypothetical protein